ncbi:MAG TPA: RluA family pseudouridine synthase, partial [Actinomycetota bacterium]|nr:RluA family pseudouridine synthase [Actinomycetota bacterium]
EGARLDAWLSEASGLNRSEIHRRFKQGAVTIEGAAATKSYRVRKGDVVKMLELEQAEVEDRVVGYDVRFADDYVIVVAKPAGVVVHPAPGVKGKTLVEALEEEFTLSSLPSSDRPGVIHRLDKDTSGLLVFARTNDAYNRLAEDMKLRNIRRRYLVLADGQFGAGRTRLEAPVGRAVRDPKKMEVLAGGRDAVTDVEVLETFGDMSYLKATLHTGRTHQIRVHLAHFGHPVIGDQTYGPGTMSKAKSLGLRRMFLHAAELELAHPVSGSSIALTEPLPDDLAEVLTSAQRLGQ